MGDLPWRVRLQSEVEAEAALKALVERIDLIDTGIHVSLKVPNSHPSRCGFVTEQRKMD
jgi:hypothetical protein